MVEMEEKTYLRTLTIAGSDSGGGAGIQADLKTFSALGCYGMSVITALTAQNTVGVSGIHPVPVSFVADQMDAVFSDIGADAVKIGMLFSVELIETVASGLRSHRAAHVVLDPVMVAQSGDKLLQDDAVDAIKTHLMPLAEVVTPNLPEAEEMLGRKIDSLEEMKQAARDLAKLGSKNILIKGGHSGNHPGTDLLYCVDADQFSVLEGEVVATQNNHGTGCTLSSAIAAFLAKGMSVEDAVREAKKYISAAIAAGVGYRIGKGHGPVHHFHGVWK